MHCNYIIARLDRKDPSTSITFRFGAPTTYAAALDRHMLIDNALACGEVVRIRYGRQWFRVCFSEVRAVDYTGRGLGSERHATRLYASELSIPSLPRVVV